MNAAALHTLSTTSSRLSATLSNLRLVTRSPVNEAQGELLRHYEGGRFAHLLHETNEDDFRVELERCKDPLLTFLLQQCSDASECRSVKDALLKLDQLASRIDLVYGELEGAEISRDMKAMKARGS